MDQELTIRERIIAIRLADKIRRNPEYANQVGLKIENSRNSSIESQDGNDQMSIQEYNFS